MARADGRIFISYRRQETAWPARQLYEALCERFGVSQVFKDVDNIAPGEDFVERISDTVGSCQVLLAMIGPLWLQVADEDGNRRIDDPDDFVRLEVATALSRGVLVVPILVDGARMPRAAELPPDLAGITRRQAIEINPTGFNLDRLFLALDDALARAAEREAAVEAPESLAAPAEPGAAPVEPTPTRAEPIAAPAEPTAAPRTPVPPAAVAPAGVTPAAGALAAEPAAVPDRVATPPESVTLPDPVAVPPAPEPVDGPTVDPALGPVVASPEPGPQPRSRPRPDPDPASATPHVPAAVPRPPTRPPEADQRSARSRLPLLIAGVAVVAVLGAAVGWMVFGNPPPTPSPSPSPSPSPTTLEPVAETVVVDRARVGTDVMCTTGRVLSITASGEVAAGRRQAGADGSAGWFDEAAPLPMAPLEALIGSVGSEWFFVGDTRTLVCPADAELELGTNSPEGTRFAGSLTAEIISRDDLTAADLDLVTVEVPATASWVASTFECAADAPFRVSATGIAGAEGGSPATAGGPDGVRPKDGKLVPGAVVKTVAHRALLGRVDEGDPFLLGSSTTVSCPDDGPLELQVNDGVLEDNTGGFTVGLSWWPQE